MKRTIFCLLLTCCIIASFVCETRGQGTLDAITPSFTVVSGPPNSIPPYSPNMLGFVLGGAGWEFTPTENLLVTSIASTASQVTFWAGANQLASFDYSVGSYDYSFESISPLLLLAGQNYSVTANYPNVTSTMIVDPGSISGDAGPTVLIAPYVSLNGYSLMATNGQLTTYSSDAVLLGPDFQFQVVSEPGIIGLSVLGYLFCIQKFRPAR